MKRSRLLKLFVILAVSAIFAVVVPLSSSADDFSQYMPDSCPQVGTAAGANEFYYYDGTNHLTVDSGVWIQVDYTDNNNASEDVYLELAHDIRTAMINRQNRITFYIAIQDSAGIDRNEVNTYINNHINQRYLDIYDLDVQLKAKGGDYLKRNLMHNGSESSNVKLGASDYSPFDYYKITLTYQYRTTAAEEKKVDEFAALWQSTFIDKNEVIQNASTINEKNYYIVKTIYNFLTLNTVYDSDVFKGNIPETNERYRISHSAYGALMNNTAGDYDWSTCTDSQGLTRIAKRSQGLSVCDGYSEVVYYLCTLNHIDCKIVEGDYDENSGKTSDLHAWNVVSLCPSDSDVYSTDNAQWYHLDATFSATSKTSVKADHPDPNLGEVIFIDYNYFLRGTAHKAFASDMHQTIFSEYPIVSAENYELKSATVDSVKSWIILTRRTNQSSFNEIENYSVISPDGVYYELEEYQEGRYRLKEKDKKIVYSGDEFYYNISIQDHANGVEYLCPEQVLINSGSYDFDALSVDGSRTLDTFNVVISPLAMNDWNSYSKFVWNDTDIKDRDQALVQNVPFSGKNLNFAISITDCAGKALVQDEDYTVRCIDRNTQQEITPFDPGEYSVLISFDGLKPNSNYAGVLIVNFDIKPVSMANISIDTQQATYGQTNIADNYRIIYFNKSETKLYEGIDYSITLNSDSMLPVGSTGSVTLTALQGSKYLIAGTSNTYDYIVSKGYDLSALSGGRFNSYEPYIYTGSPITLTSSQIKLSNNDILLQGRDYDILSYSNNVNAGTASALVAFKKNYCGTITVYFTIYPSNAVLVPDTPDNKAQNNQSSGVSAPPADSGQNTGNPITLTVKKVSGLKAVYSSDAVTLRWDSQGTNIFYHVEMYDSKSKVWRLLASTDKNTFKSKYPVVGNKKGKFTANTQYKYRVRAFYEVMINGNTMSDYSSYTVVNADVPVKTPAKPKSTAGKASMTVKWSKVSKASGYQIQYSKNSKFKKGNKTVTAKGSKVTSKKIKGLKSKSTYYVRIRAYSKIGGKTVYSPYSKTVKVKVK